MNTEKGFAEIIGRLITAFLDENLPDPLNLKGLSGKARVLPLLLDMGGVFAINLKGEILFFTFDDFTQSRTETDQRIKNIVIFQGRQKYPELEQFKLERPHSAQTCPHCDGTGIAPLPHSLTTNNFNCYCGGLGWIP